MPGYTGKVIHAMDKGRGTQARGYRPLDTGKMIQTMDTGQGTQARGYR